MCEMVETSTCLEAATSDSLIILDELGRGTSTHDGYAIAYAVLKHLTLDTQGQQGLHYDNSSSDICSRKSSIKPRVLFATHYHGLPQEPLLKGQTLLRHMAVDHGTEMVPLFKLRAGAAPEGSCGIQAAALAGLPDAVVERAAQVAAAMETWSRQRRQRTTGG
jgi:DNA mismatch repair ATPase MutS